MSVAAGTPPTHPSGDPAATGYLIDATLLYPVPAGAATVASTAQPSTPGTPAGRVTAAIDVITDCLLYAGATLPQPGQLASWFPAYTGVLTQLGWTTTDTASTGQPLGGGHGQPGSTAVPWQSIRNQITGTTPPSVLAALDALIGALHRLPAPAAQRWTHRVVTGSSAAAVIAVAEVAAATCQLHLTAATLTYPDTGHAPALPGFPDQPVPTAGTAMTVYQTTMQFDMTGLIALQTKLDPLVAAAKPTITTITS